jgi:hypothetical protein
MRFFLLQIEKTFCKVLSFWSGIGEKCPGSGKKLSKSDEIRIPETGWWEGYLDFQPVTGTGHLP